MWLHYLKSAARNLFKNRLYSLINLSGLMIGFVCVLLISLYVREELSYDRFNTRAGRIYLVQQFENYWGSGGRLVTDLRARFPQVQKTARLKNTNPLIKVGETAYYEPNFYFADSSIFEVFTFPLLKGNAGNALSTHNGVVISEKMALKYFPGVNPIGKEINYEGKYSLQVTGVMRNLPANSQHKIDFLASYAGASQILGWDIDNNYWGGDTWSYILLAPGADPARLQAQFPEYIRQLNDPNAAYVWRLRLIPLRDIYLKTSLIGATPIVYVYLFSLIGLFILALACFNYINLSTARSSSRAKEVGVRKVMGSSMVQLRGQFLLETALLVLLAVVSGMVILRLILPWFNLLSDRHLSVGPLLHPMGILAIILGMTLLSLIAGLYPAFILASYRPATVLKGELAYGKSKTWLRKTLVVLQFSVSMIMITATLIVYQQLHFIRHKNIGYNRSQILTMDLRDAPERVKVAFKQEVKKLSAVEDATRAFGLPGSGSMMGTKLINDYVPRGVKDAGIRRLTIDGDYLHTFDIRLTEGRMLSDSSMADKHVFLINEAAKKYFGWKTISGKMTGYYTFRNKQEGGYEEVPVRGQVVGVIGDYNHASLKSPVEPMIISLNEGPEGQMAIRLKATGMADGIAGIKKLWGVFFPGKPFEYSFLDNDFDNTYKSENKTAGLFAIFAVLAIVISCLGLLGLIAHVAESRRREIGIRKMLGASVAVIIRLLAREFFLLIIIAWLTAIPLSYWAMNQWLRDFAFRININIWTLLLSGIGAVLIGLLSISFQAFKSALENPVKSMSAER